MFSKIIMDAPSVNSVDLPANKMSKVEILQGIITERMTTAVREILAVIETTVTGYEDEVLLLKRELRQYKRKLHAILQPQIHLNRIDLDGVGTPDITATPSHSIELTRAHVQKGAENDDCIASEKCIGENEVDGLAKTEKRPLELEESDCALADDSSAYREEGLTDESVNEVHNTKGKRRRQLPGQYRLNNNVTDGNSDNSPEKNSDNEWKPNKKKKLRSSNVKKNRVIKLRVGLLKNSPGTDLSNNAFNLEGPVQTTLCQQNLRESDFINQLRSIFPELGETTPFDAYLDNSTNESAPRLSNKMTLNELYNAFKAQEQKRFDFYLQKREHGDTLTNTTLLFAEKPTTKGLEEATPLETEGTSNLRDEMCNFAATMDSAAQSEDGDDDDDDDDEDEDEGGADEDEDDDDWKPTQNSEDEEHNADPKCEKKDTGEQRLNCDTCQLCGYIFRSSTLLTKHALSHLDNPKRMCGVCGKQLESSEELKTHLESHQKLHQCDTCGRYFVTFASLQKHIDTHRIEKPFKCNICQKVFASNELLKEHKLHHKNNKPYKCDMCPQSFKFKTRLDDHYRKHTGDKLYCCDVCGKTLTTYRGLSQHKLIHSGEKNYSCQQCGKKFYTEMFRKRHEKVHTVREKKHLCDLCSKTFLSKEALQTHLKMHDNSHMVKCYICHKLLKGHISEHMKTHTGEKPFSCKECGKKFKCKTHLENHTLVIHDNIKPLTCTLCGYKCARKHYLDSHMRTHTGHKPYKCTVCDQAFTQSHCLKKHMNSHQTEDQC